MIFACNTSEADRNTKVRNEVFYLDSIKAHGGEFEKLEAFCTDGDIRPPYPYQWRATAKLLEGDDDQCEGLGGRPLEALRELYRSVKARSANN